MTTFGEVSWNDDVFGGEKKVNSKDLFLRLEEGSNELRLITQPFQYLVHKYKKDESDKYGQKVGCSAIHGSCPLCDAGDKAKPRWLLGVISRKSNTYKILDISYAVFSDIRKLARNVQRWGDPTKYDIDIVVDKNGGPTGYYSVQPISKEPLSATDQKIKDDADIEDLKRRVTPPTPAMVVERINRINGADSASNAGKASASVARPVGKTVVAPKAPQVSMTDDEDLDHDFPAHEG
jgi:hypothetical protein